MQPPALPDVPARGDPEDLSEGLREPGGVGVSDLSGGGADILTTVEQFSGGVHAEAGPPPWEMIPGDGGEG